jgi:radical SAM superfamily enzyme YgiQ (UPF0313 family)
MITFVLDPYIIDPLGIAYLAAMLRREKMNCQLVLTPELDKRSLSSSPVVGFSVTTGTHKHFAQISRNLKEIYPNLISVFGGPHCTFFPKFIFEQGVDYLIRGEGFSSIVDFMKNYDYVDEARTTPGICYEDEESQETSIAQSVDVAPAFQVSALPFPDRAIIYQFPKNKANPIRNIMATFGCPRDCSYCYNKRFQGLGYPLRSRSVESVIEEAAQLITNYPTDLVFFQDDIFPIYRKDWIESFSRQWLERIKKPFHIQIRIEMLREDSLKQLKGAGLHGVTFAVETADYERRSELLNRAVEDVEIYHGISLLHRFGVRFRIENMLGLPHETLQDVLNTLDFNIACKPDIGWASLYTPYPGTDLGDCCFHEKLVDMEAWDADFFTHATLKLPDKKRIERTQKLFSLACAYPKVRPLIPFLSKLPFSYKGVYKKVKQRLYDKRLYKV